MSRTKSSVWLCVAAVLCLAAGLAARPAVADIVVNVDQGINQPLPIAIPKIGGSPVGAQISQVVTADLQRSGLFRPLDPTSFQQQITDVNVQPNFNSWKAISAQALLTGAVVGDADGRLRVDVRLWDVYAGEQLLGLQFSSAPENWRRIAHKIADAVYEKLTGEKGYFDTRIVFVAVSGPSTKPIRRLAIMDQDGANPSYLTNGAALVFSPRFSPTSQEITFMSLRPSGSSIYLFNIETGREEALGHFQGMVFAPRFSPDGNKVAFSLVRNGNSDLYVMDLGSRAVRRLTFDPSIDTSPSFSPDGSQIVFNSDRDGTPELYVMSAGGGSAHRISFGEGRYTDPVWSPDGKYIAFTKQTGQTFHIGIVRPDGSGETILTSSYMDEAPDWAPNSRVIIFTRRSRDGIPRLWTTDISGRMTEPAPYPLPAADAAWSPLLN